MQVYTDASKTPDGKTSAAFIYTRTQICAGQNNMLAKIYEIVSGIKNSITLVAWIPSHLGIKGNGMADNAAQRTIGNECVNFVVKLELK